MRLRTMVEHRPAGAAGLAVQAGVQAGTRRMPALPAGAAYNTAVMDHLWTPWRYAYVTGADRGRPKLGVPEALAAWPGETHCVFCNMIAAVDYAEEHGMAREQAEAAVYLLDRKASCRERV